MLTSFFSGLSGLNSNSTYISVIGNNLANVNTVGYKGDAVSFADVLHATPDLVILHDDHSVRASAHPAFERCQEAMLAFQGEGNFGHQREIDLRCQPGGRFHPGTRDRRINGRRERVADCFGKADSDARSRRGGRRRRGGPASV